MDNLEVKIKSTKESMHEAVQKALDDFIEYAEDNLNLKLDMFKEDWLGPKEELTYAVDEARDLLNDAKEQRRHFLNEDDIHSLLDNGPRDEQDDKEVESDINELKENVSYYVDAIGDGEAEDEMERELNEAIDDIRCYYHYYYYCKKSIIVTK